MTWKTVALAVIALLIVTNLVTGVQLRSSARRWQDLSARQAGMAAGQVYEASADLESVSTSAQADSLLRAVTKLETAYYALYELELQNQLPGGPRRWSESVNVIQQPLQFALSSGDYSGLPAAKQRLKKLADLLKPNQGDPLAQLRAARSRLDEVFAK
jgi:hypothetical protein